MPFGFVPQVGIVAWLLGLHDTSAQAPTSWSLSVLWPDAGSVKPIATMMPRQNCFIVLSTQVQSRAVKHADQTHFQVQKCPPWAFPRRLCNSQGIGTPRWQLDN